MNKHHIELTDDEKQLLAKIDLRVHQNHDDAHAAYKTNREPILALLKSLRDRNIIPRERLSYWSDPAYNSGRVKASRKGLFERNGCEGADIYTHPNFLQFLRYFLFGATLPDPVIAAFEEKVGNPEWVTSGDIIPMGKFARELTRRHGLQPAQASEEFFKLCLDMGLGLSTAQSVMRAVKQTR
jgi:hypothetical protein